MGVFDQLQTVLQQYSSGTTAAAEDHAQVEQHFDQVATAVPQSTLAEGLAAAFRSNQTPAFSQMIGSLFNQSNGEQKAGILNQLLASAGPGVLAGLGGGAAAGGLASLLRGGQVSPEQAQQVPPEAVQQLADHAEKKDPSIVDQASAFYAQHSTLVKSLGAAALVLTMSRMSQQNRA
jgi:hypothetical protein